MHAHRHSNVETAVEEAQKSVSGGRDETEEQRDVSAHVRLAETYVRREEGQDAENVLQEEKKERRKVLADETTHLDRIGHFSETDMKVALERFRELQERPHGKLSQELLESYDVLAKVSKDLQDVADEVHNLPQISYEFKDQLDMYSKMCETKWKKTATNMETEEASDGDLDEVAHSSEFEHIMALKAEMKLSEAAELLHNCTNLPKGTREGIRAELGKDLLELAHCAGPQDMEFFHDCVRTLGVELNYPELAVQAFIRFHDRRQAFLLQAIEDIPKVNEEEHNTAILELIDTYFCTISETFEAFKDVLGAARRGQQILAPFVIWIRGQSSELFQSKLSLVAAQGSIPSAGLESVLEHFTRQFAGRYSIYLRKVTLLQ